MKAGTDTDIQILRPTNRRSCKQIEEPTDMQTGGWVDSMYNYSNNFRTKQKLYHNLSLVYKPADAQN